MPPLNSDLRCVIPLRSRSLALVVASPDGVRQGFYDKHSPRSFAAQVLGLAPELALTGYFKHRAITGVEMPDGSTEENDPARTLARRIIGGSGGHVVRLAPTQIRGGRNA